MYAKSFEKYDRVVERIKGGERLEPALKAEEMSAATYYSAKKIRSKKPKIYSAKRGKKLPAFIDVPLKSSSTKVAVIVTTTENLKAVLEGLQ